MEPEQKVVVSTVLRNSSVGDDKLFSFQEAVALGWQLQQATKR
jgi:hypothetical protein